MSKPHVLLPVGLFIVLGLSIATAETPTDQPAGGVAALNEKARASTPAEREARIRAALDAATQVEFIDNPLKEGMEFLADLHSIQILLDENALTQADIAIDEPINQTLNDISLRSALHIMLEPLGLTYVIEDEVLKITTRDAAAKKLQTRIYDVRALERSGLEPEALVRLITSTIDFGNWRDDGRSPVVETIPGGLLVAQTETVHEKIVELLAELTAFAANAADDEARP